MFWVVIILVVALIIGGSVIGGRMIEKRDGERHGAHGKAEGHKLSRRDKLNLARVAGVIPSQDQNEHH